MTKQQSFSNVAKRLDFLLVDSTFFCYGKNNEKHNQLEYYDFILDSFNLIGNLYVPKAIFMELHKGVINFRHIIHSIEHNNSNRHHRGTSKHRRQQHNHNSSISYLKQAMYKEQTILDKLDSKKRILEPTPEMSELEQLFQYEIKNIPHKKHALSEPDISLLTNALYLANQSDCGMVTNDIALEDVALAIASENYEYPLETYVQTGRKIKLKK